MVESVFYSEADCDIAEFTALIESTLDPTLAPSACDIQSNVPLYDCGALKARIAGGDPALLSEWSHLLIEGSGVLVLKGAYEDMSVLDAATDAYHAIIAEEKAQGGGGADHFAAAGANDRVWNSLQKLCFVAPDVYARVFANLPLARCAEAYLGPGYQMTAQINLVRPGGKAQTGHRDYHLGFQTIDQARAIPKHAHHFSPMLTLQGGIAHCDMPVESGPTKLLPFSQKYGPGYIAYRLPEFAALFEERFVQLPLEKGDVIYFSPALFHGAGDNVSADIQRMVNLVQVSSPYGIALERINRAEMCKVLYPVLQKAGLPEAEEGAAIASTADGYPFPTNLDTDPPVGGLAPKTQADLMRESLAAGVSAEDFNAALDAQEAKRLA